MQRGIDRTIETDRERSCNEARIHEDNLWHGIRKEVGGHARAEPILASFLHATILNHCTLDAALSYHLANKLDSPTVQAITIREVIDEALRADPDIGFAVRCDIRAFKERDPACDSYSAPLLYYKGFHALQAHRVAHWLWKQQRRPLALFLQNRISEVFAVDIHPAARIGAGILLDHATGLVVGETTVVEDNVSIMHSVTLGGTGKDTGDRHPKICSGVLISAGATILGNVKVGEGAQVGASSVVLSNVPAHVTVAGVPARIVGSPAVAQPALEMDHNLSRQNDGK